MRIRHCLALLVPIALSAACGGSGSTSAGSTAAPDSGADKSAIATLAGDVSIDKDPATTCSQGLTPAFVSAVYGDQANCVQPHDSDPSDVPSGAATESIKVTGDTATAKVTQQFGPNAIGAAGTWTFARSGANWQVSEWGIDFLRSYVGTVFSPAYQSSDPTSDPIADASYRACVASALQVAPDASFRPIAYGLLSNRNTALGQLVVGCDAKAPGGTSPWWKVLENAISGTDKSTLGIQISTCMMSGLHAKYSDGDIINVIMNENGTSGAKSVQDEMTAVGKKCGKQAVAGKLPTVKKGGHTTAGPKP